MITRLASQRSAGRATGLLGLAELFAEDVGPDVDELPVVDCAVEPTHEIFAVIEHSADVYPGFKALEAFA